MTDKDEAILDPKGISELFDNYFSGVANGIEFDNSVESTKDATIKHPAHPSIWKI